MSVRKAYIRAHRDRPQIGMTIATRAAADFCPVCAAWSRSQTPGLNPQLKNKKKMAQYSDRIHADEQFHVDVAGSDQDLGEDVRRIGDLAKEYGVSLRTLRFYEDKGLLNPERAGSTRLYHHRDVARLKLILLGRKVGFSLREVKQLMDLYDRNGTNIRQYKAVVDRSTRQLGRLEKQRAELDAAISTLKDVISTTKEKLTALPTGKPN